MFSPINEAPANDSQSSCTELVLEIKNRNRKAFDILYHRYSDAIYGTILRFIKNEVLAEEICQNVFVKIWLHIDSYDANKGRLFTWMLTISKREIIDAYRKKSYRQSQDTISIDCDKSDFVHCTPVWDKLDLPRAIAVLPNNDRTLVDLIHLKGYTFQQTAEMLAIPLGTVKTNMRRVYKKLKLSLA